MIIHLFASKLPCKVSEYKFKNLSESESNLLTTSSLSNKTIKSKGDYLDFYGCVDFDGFVLIRQKDGLNMIFKFDSKDGHREFSEVQGFTMPFYPDAFLLSEGVTLYSFNLNKGIKKDANLKFNSKNVIRYLKEYKLDNGYKLYKGIVTPITKQLNEVGIDLPEEFYKDLDDLWNKNSNDHSGLMVNYLTNGKSSKLTACIFSLHSQRLYDGVVIKDGTPEKLEDITDLHSHLVPSVDDGSSSVKETLELAKDLKDLGITQIVMTPHNNEDYHNPSLDSEMYNEVEDKLEKVGIKTDLSNEHRITQEFLDNLSIDRKLNTHPNDYLLIEFGQTDDRDFILRSIGKLAFYYPRLILAHAERYKNLTTYDIMLISSTGILIQSNFKSIDDEQDNDVIYKTKDLIKSNYIDLVATDTHHEDHIEQTKDHIEDFKDCLVFNNLFKL